MGDGEEEIQSASDYSTLANLNRNPSPSYGVNTNDMSNYDFGMDAEDIAAYDQSRPATGALRQQDYYPGYHPGGNGSYSGRMIGSTTLFGGGGALVPLGMLDAQEAAVQNAAFQRAKGIDDFQKQYNKPPSSKLTNLNENLSKEYITHVQSSWQKALRKAGGNPRIARELLKNDVDFNVKTRSFENYAKMGDAIANKIAQDDLDIKTGKFTPTPEYTNYRRKLQRALDPSDPEFKNLTNVFMGTKVEREFSDALQEVMKNDIINENSYPADIDTSNPDFIKIVERSKKNRTPEQQENYARTLAETVFAGSDHYDYETLLKKVKAVTSGVSSKTDVKITNKRDTSANDDFDYTSAQPQTETETNFQDANGGVSSVFGQNAYKTTAKHEAMELKIPISENMVDTKGDKVSDDTGYLKGTVSGIQNGYYDKVNKRFLNKQEVAELLASDKKNHNIEVKTVAVFNADPKKTGGAKNTILVDANEIKGKFKNPKKGSGQRDFDDLIVENQKASEEANNKLHVVKKKEEPPTATKEPETKPAAAMITVEVDGKLGQIPADKWDAFKKKYPKAKRS